jgi:hypothetical protein
MVVVALGEPGVPVVCWAIAGKIVKLAEKTNPIIEVFILLIFLFLKFLFSVAPFAEGW